MKIEIELWMLYFFEARNNRDALLDLYRLFQKVAGEYPLVEAFSVKAMFQGYISELISK